MSVESQTTAFYEPKTSSFEASKNPVEKDLTWKNVAAGAVLTSAGVYLIYKGITNEHFVQGAILFGIGSYMLYQGMKQFKK